MTGPVGAVVFLAGVAVTLPVVVAVIRYGWSDLIHNCVAHPLLALWPRLGEQLHQRTEPADTIHEDPLAGVAATLARQTVWLIAAETLDHDHLDDLEAQNIASGHDEHGSYDHRLHQIIQRRRAELVTMARAPKVWIPDGDTVCTNTSHWIGGAVGEWSGRGHYVADRPASECTIVRVVPERRL